MRSRSGSASASSCVTSSDWSRRTDAATSCLRSVRPTARAWTPTSIAPARVGEALGGKHVAVDAVVDKNLLGGFVAEIGSVIVDGSLDGQLARLKERLARG